MRTLWRHRHRIMWMWMWVCECGPDGYGQLAIPGTTGRVWAMGILVVQPSPPHVSLLYALELTLGVGFSFACAPHCNKTQLSA